MIVFKHIPFWFLFKTTRWFILSILGLCVLTWYLHRVLEFEEPTFLLPSMTVFGTVLSLFLAFRTNESYNRWWEARTLWGQLINVSRSFAREVLTLIGMSNSNLDEQQLKEFQKSLIYRHLAYINALRFHLRRQGNYKEVLNPFLNNSELDDLRSAVNKPTMINLRQGKEIKKHVKSEGGGEFRYVQLSNSLNAMLDVQGGCERIKNTVFPRIYSYFTTAFTYLFSAMLIISLVDEFDWQTLLVRAIVAYVFIILDQLGRGLKNPFENVDADIPMTAMCRTIEIDLRQMLGEKDLPKPVEPVNGILM